MNYYNMSPQQKNIYDMAKRYGNSCIGNIGGIIRYGMDVDEVRLHKAAIRVLELNPALALRVDTKGRLYSGSPMDVYYQVIPAEDYSDEQFDELVESCTNIPIWGSDKSLVHYYMIRRSDCVCLLGMCHHMVCDGIGLINVTDQLYRLGSDKDCELWDEELSPDNSYLDYLKECKVHFKDGKTDVAGLLIDNNRISSYISMWDSGNISFPMRRESNSNKALIVRKMISQTTCEDMLKWCNEHSFTVEHLYEAALARYYSEITGSGVISLGRVLAGRRKKYMNTAGMFSNILPLFVEAGEDLTALCAAIKAQELQMLRCESLDLDKLRAAKGITERMYDTSITYRPLKRLPVAGGMHIDEVECNELELPLRILIDERSDGILLTYKYLSDIYTENEIERLHSAVMKLMNACVSGEGCNSLLHSVFACEDTVLKHGNDISFRGHNVTDVVDDFYRCVRECPDAICITDTGIDNKAGDKGLDISYLAAAGYISLIEYAVFHNNESADERPNGGSYRVGLKLSRSFRMPLAMLACLKMGITFVPINMDETMERLEDMSRYLDRIIDDDALDEITGKDYISLFDRLMQYGADSYSDDAGRRLSGMGDGDIAPNNSTAYAINTSGSTGSPKLVEILRSSLNIRISWMVEELGLEGCRVLQKTRNTFDVSIWELLLPLTCKGKVLILPNGLERDPSRIGEAVSRYRIDTIHFVPSMLSAFIEWQSEARKRSDLTSIKNVISSGEALPAYTASKLFEMVPGVRLYNLYGPAECTIDVSFHACKPGEEIIPIGVPVWETDLRIINENGMELPDGYIGEIVIAGELVGRGYVDNDYENSRHFAEHDGVRFYKTGDMGYIADSGEIIYTGRADREIKLRGMRVNLDVLEGEALSIPGVDAAAVTVSGSHMYLFVRSDLARSDIRTFLAKRLAPHYMPDSIINVDAMPVNANGKCDYNALMKMAADVKKVSAISRDGANAGALSDEALNTANTYNICERIAVSCISKVFKKNDVSLNDKLTDFDMDSLSVVSIMVELEKAGYTLAYEDVYSAETVEDLAIRISREGSSFSGRRRLICTYPWDDDNEVKVTKNKRLVLAVPYAGTDIHIFDTLACEFHRLGYTFAAFNIGESGKSVEALADIGERELMDLMAEGITEVILIGCCVGSALAIEMGKRLKKIDNVSLRTVLIGSLPGRFIGNVRRRKLMWDIVPGKLGRSLINALYGERVYVPESVYTRLRRDARRCTAYIEEHRSSGDRLSSDVLLIYGSRDILTLGYGRRLREWQNYINGDMSVKELKGAYHFCTHAYAGMIVYHILDWVQGLG